MPLPPGDEHVMAERDVQEVVAQRSAASRSSKNAVGVKFLAAKLMPFIVTVAPLSVGMLIDETAERIGESYVKADLRVPTMAPTVRIKGTLDPYDAPSVLHDNEEYVSHDVVSHGTSAVCAVVLESNAPKFIPTSVTDAPELVGVFFGERLVGTGASNVNPPVLVPTTAEIVTAVLSLPPTPPFVAHLICVSLTQMLLPHNDGPRRTVGDRLAIPNPVPASVIEYTATGGPFALKNVVTGASNVKEFRIVPTMAPTETVSASLTPLPATPVHKA
jgi:hypothetical protein